MKDALCVYIGRFSTFHNGHAEVARRALCKYARVLIIVGSAKQPRTIKNPWKAEERVRIIRAWYEEERKQREEFGQLIILTSRDYRYNNNLWLIETQKLIASVQGSDKVVWITGSKRDDTSFYLDMFPRPSFELDLAEENRRVSLHLSATWCREIYFGRTFNGQKLDERGYDILMRSFVPPTTIDFLDSFEKTDDFAKLIHEFEVTSERKAAAVTNYGERIDITIDNVVIQSGHVLLIRRRSAPGKGLWALPGGYLNPREWSFDGSLRELDEETKIDCPPAVLKNSLVFDHWFEHPDRSNINRVITHAFCFKLPDYKINGRVTLPKVTAEDDADRARWVPLAEALAMSEVLFDDHHDILEEFIGRLNNKGQK
jgi:bifunctional NMN adenylyltransferase/nudix hydrolase